MILHGSGEHRGLGGKTFILGLCDLLVFQIVDLLESRFMDGFLQDGLVSLDGQFTGGDSLAEDVGGAAGVLAGIFGKNMHDVQRYESKVKAFAESRPLLNRGSIEEPLNFQSWVRDGNDTALKVSFLSFHHFNRLEGAREDGNLGS
jgi:hypothetical protein